MTRPVRDNDSWWSALSLERQPDGESMNNLAYEREDAAISLRLRYPRFDPGAPADPPYSLAEVTLAENRRV